MLNPYWADEEFQVRKQAVEAHRRLTTGESVTVYVSHPDANSGFAIGYDELRFHPHDFAYMGGLEGVLLIEETIRRARSMSIEQKYEQYIAQIKDAAEWKP